MTKRFQGRQWCFVCKEYVTKNNLGYASHMQKHVSEGTATKTYFNRYGRRLNGARYNVPEEA